MSLKNYILDLSNKIHRLIDNEQLDTVPDLIKQRHDMIVQWLTEAESKSEADLQLLLMLDKNAVQALKQERQALQKALANLSQLKSYQTILA